ncbi:SphA family protein [Marinomonas gallaica]|uniref:SphA family protein n=1 Tax=Marinomonas gallaica TaxID=1806667 RepID=UPI000834A1C5|nr:transporter [Marinomonas gallaica]
MKKIEPPYYKYAGLTLALTFSALASATESGSPSTAVGVYDFGAGYLPPATENGTIATRINVYSADKLANNNGDSTPGQDFNLDVLSVSAVYLNMTDTEILGGRYGYSAIVPFLRMDGSISVSVPGVGTVFEDSAELFKLGDIQFIPLMLGWNPAPNMAFNTQFAIQAPTGDYDQNRFISPGLNHWVFTPSAAFSYISQSGFEVSSNFQLDISTRNDDTDYKNGLEFRHEFAVGQHVDEWTVGLGGYYYRQLTDDKTGSNYAGQPIVDGNKLEVLALGPAISYFSPGKPTVLFHAYKEFDAKNRTEGYNVAVRVAHSF